VGDPSGVFHVLDDLFPAGDRDEDLAALVPEPAVAEVREPRVLLAVVPPLALASAERLLRRPGICMRPLNMKRAPAKPPAGTRGSARRSTFVASATVKEMSAAPFSAARLRAWSSSSSAKSNAVMLL
jgi:hypothetical protein